MTNPEQSTKSKHTKTEITNVLCNVSGSDILFDSLTIRGKAEAGINLFVKIMDPAFGEVSCGSTVVNTSGNWSLTWDLPFSSGSYSARVHGAKDHPFHLGQPGPCAGLAVC